MRALSKLVSLEHLDIGNVLRVTDIGITSVCGLVNLKHLNICRHRLTDLGVAALSGLGALQYLRADRCENLTDSGLAALSDCVLLRHLDISGCPNITDAGMESLASVVGLRSLRLTVKDCNLRDQVGVSKDGLMVLPSSIQVQHN